MLTKEWSRVKLSDRKKLPEEEVDISKIATWQNMVNSKGVERIIKGENTEHQGKNAPAIFAVKHGGQYVIMDGNHRVTADILMGKKKVKVKVYESKT